MDRVRRCRLLMPFQESIVSSGKNINSASKVVNWIIVYRYSQVHVSLLTLCYHWQSFIWGATNIYTYMYTNTDRFTLLALHVQGNT